MLRFGLCITFMALCLTLAIVPPAFSQWQQVALDGQQVNAVAFIPGSGDTAYAAVYRSDGGIYKSADGGTTWALAGSLAWADDIVVDPLHHEIVYVICGDAIWRTTDAGTTWQRKDDEFDFILFDVGPVDIAVNPGSPETVYVTTAAMTGGGKLYRSPDQAENWYQVDMPWLNQKGPIAIDPARCGRMFVAEGWNGPLLRSLDSGNTWEGVLSVVADDIAINPQNPNTVYVAADGMVYRSLDGGDTWTAFGSEAGLTELIRRVAVNPVNPAIVFALGGTCVFKSIDGGTTWYDFSDGLPGDVHPSSIAIDGENGEVILIGTYNDGIYRRTCSLASVRSIPNGTISLEVLPNPVSATSSIAFTLPIQSLTTLKIYDIRGRLVEKLLGQEVSAGYHSATWDTRDQSGTLVSPGIYYVELEAGTERIVKPIVLLR